MQIFSHNTAPANRWEGYDPYGNHFRIDDLAVADWVKANKGKESKDFYAQKDKIIADNVKRIFSENIGTRVDMHHRTSPSQYSYEMRHVLGASEQWEKFASIKNGGTGRLIEIDIETFGNTRYGGKHDVFGITEIGITDKAYGFDGGAEYSLGIGITKRQQEYLNAIVDKYESSSWDLLSAEEQVALSRASVYADITRETIADGPFSGLVKISGVRSSASTDVGVIRKGIEQLSGIETKASDVLPRTLGWAQGELQKDNVLFSFANGNFDLDSFLNALRNDTSLFDSTNADDIARKSGLIQAVQTIKGQQLDAIYAIRAMAGAEDMSVESFMEQYFGVRVGAAIDKQMQARHISGSHIHSGLSDTGDQIKIVEDITDELFRTYQDSAGNEYTRMEKMQSHFTDMKASDLYLFHHGQLNRREGLEFATTVNSQGKRIGHSNYSFTGEYWIIDEANSKYIDVDNEQKYALTFVNAAEIASGKSADEATTFTIVRDSMEDAFDFVERNAKSFAPGKVTKKQRIGQQDIKYKDFGRREFERMQDVASVATDYAEGEIVGGYSTFSKFIDLEEAIGSKLDSISGAREKVEYVMEYVQANYRSPNNPDAPTSPISTYSLYEAQAFVGMHERLQSELPLLKDIKISLDTLSTKDVPEEEKTALLRQIYRNTKEYIDSNHRYKSINSKKDPYKYFSMSDVFGIDIQVGKELRRINAYDKRTAQAGIHSALKSAVSGGGVNRDEVIKVINQLHEKSLIIDTDYDRILTIANNISKDGLYGLSVDIAGSVYRSVEDITEGYGGRTSVIKYFASHGNKSKNARFLGRDLNTIYDIDGFADFYSTKEHQSAIDSIISKTIKNRAGFYKTHEYGSESSKGYIYSLLRSLGYGTDVSDSEIAQKIATNGTAEKIISEIFYPTKNGEKKGFIKNYTLDYYDKAGIKSFIITPNQGEDGSSFILMTRAKDAGRLQQKLLSGELDFSSRQALIKSGIYEYGAFEELKKINRYQLDGAELLTVTQGENFEKILTPNLNTRVGSDGVLRAYLNNAEYDFYSQHRKVGGNALEFLRHGEYESASKLFVKATDEYLEELSASASYRGVMTKDGVKRIAVLGPSDFIQAREIRLFNGLKSVFDHGVLNSPMDPQNLNVAQQVVHAFGKSMGIPQGYNEDTANWYRRILNSSEFNEFFLKRMYVGTIGGDENFNIASVAGDILLNGNFDQNFYQVIRQVVSEDVDNKIFGVETTETLGKLKDFYRQLLGETKVGKGFASEFDAADYNGWAILHNTMRPTFGQQNNGMYFDPDSMDMSLFDGLFDINGDSFQKSFFIGRTELTRKELRDKQALSKSGYNPFDEDGFDILRRERNFTAQVKQMSNFELQSRYITLRESGSSAKYGITDDQYKRGIEYFEKQLMSLHEDKIFIAPGLNEQELFATRDYKKFKLNWDGIDEEFTSERLTNLIGTEIDSKTVIGRRTNGEAVFYHGPATTLTSENVSELLLEGVPDSEKSNRRMTRILPTIGDIVDNKIMMNGAEKATVHSIDSRLFAEYIGVKDLEIARRIANQMFGELSGGAVAIANMGGQKHANMMQTHSIWNAMATMYQEAGYGEAFVGYLNTLVNKQGVFSGIKEFGWEEGRITLDVRAAKNASGAIEYIFNQLSSDEMIDNIHASTGRSKDEILAFNSQIIDYINFMQENNILLTTMQRQTMNEHMGTHVVVDDRIKQAIITRGIRPGGDGVQDIDLKWYESLEEFSKNYDGKGNYGIGGQLQELIDVYSQRKNDHRIAMSGESGSLQRTVIGIVESLRYANDPNAVNIEGSNIVKVNVQELIERQGRVKGGSDGYELANSIFFVDGKPSEFLKELARKSNVDLSGSYSIYLDLNGKEITMGKHTYKGMLLPVQSVFSDVDDKVFFKNSQGQVTSLINNIIDVFTTPSKLGKNETIEDYLSARYKQFKINMENQISVLDKDSDAYKAFNQYVAPISHQFLAQDEVSPLVDAMFSDQTYKLGDEEYTFRGLVNEKTRLEKLIMDNTMSNADAYAKRYDEVQGVISNIVESIADNIKTDSSYYTGLVGGEANKRFIEAGAFFENGVKHYGLTVAIGETAFENMGYDFGVIGLDIVNDYLAGGKNFEKMNEFSANNLLHLRVKQIAKELEGTIGHEIDPNNLVQEINTYVQKQYGVTTAELNNAIANNQSILDILNPFRQIGVSYMEQVGTYAEMLRYPMFRSQPMVRLMIDKALQGNQVRSSSPILSYLSHVDHDGDTEFIMGIANGMSIMKSTDERFQYAQTIYRRFGKDEYRELLADSVKSMGGLKSELIADIKLERAKVLEKFKKSEYEQGIADWKIANGIDLDAKLSPSQELAAQRSSQMEAIFLKNGFNSVEDSEAFIAAMAARIRKANIGKVSTPNYTLRNALLGTYNDKSLTKTQRLLINDTYHTLSNMFSEAGGFFSEVEQKVIDPKHGRDGMTIARTSKYTMGISRLFAGKKIDDTRKALHEIMEAVGPGLFGAHYGSDIDVLVDLVLNNSMETFKRSEMELRVHGKINISTASKELLAITDVNVIRTLTGLRGLIDIKEQIPGFKYKNSLNKGSFEAEIYDLIEGVVNRANRNEVDDAFLNTASNNLVQALAGKQSTQKTELIQDHMYFISGGIGHSPDDRAFVYNRVENGKFYFHRVDVKTGEIDYSKELPFRKTHVFDDIIPVSASEFKRDRSIRNNIHKQLERNRIAKSLNTMVFDKQGNINTAIPDTFYRSQSLNADLSVPEEVRQYYQKTWKATDEIFNGQFTGHTTRAENEARYKEIAKIVKAYDHAASSQRHLGGSILKTGTPDSSGELIRQINQYIANNAENYGSFDTDGFYTSTQDYLQILRNLVSERFEDGEKGLDKFIDIVIKNPDMDYELYDKALAFLNADSYDIIAEEARYNQVMAEIDTSIQDLKENGADDSSLQPLKNLRNRLSKTELMNEMTAHNQGTVLQAQQDIYQAIGGTKQSISNFFGFGNSNVSSVKVGFGAYIGQEFSKLSEADVKSIIDSAVSIIKEGNDDFQTFAAQQTYSRLKGYKATSTQSVLSFNKLHDSLTAVNNDLSSTYNTVRNTVENKKAARIRQMAEDMATSRASHGGGVEKKTLTGSMLNSIKNFDTTKLPMKQIGIGAAGLVALGLVNKVLHKNDKGSPLSPKRNDNQGDAPGTDNGYGYAPPSATQTIYADNSSGIQYRVSAKSKNYISDMQNARLINMGGGGNSQVYSSSDTSGVTDNWLANKFAELT